MILEDKRNFLKVSDVNGGETVTFQDEGKWIESKNYTNQDGSPRNDFVIKIKILDLDKDMRLNATNRSILRDAWGKDTVAWIGKKAELSKVKVLVGGQKLDTIEVIPL